MFSSLDNAAREAKELAFRKAAAANNTNKMIELSKGLNINAVAEGESSSRQTAAHRAAAAGHVDALRLLFNLGADFSLLDKNNKTPRELVANNDKETALLFTLIEDANRALQARKQFFPLTVENLSKDSAEYKQHHASHDALTKAIQCGPFATELFATYKMEAAKNHDYDINDAKMFIQQFDACVSYLRHLEGAKLLIDHTFKHNKMFCSCGEASFVSILALSYRDKVTYPVEELNILSKMNDETGHSCIVLARDTSLPLQNLASFKNALILDPFKSRIFFYQFVTQYKEDTVCKVLNKFNLEPGVSNQYQPFPSIMKFPQTKVLYEKFLRELSECYLRALDERCPTNTAEMKKTL